MLRSQTGGSPSKYFNSNKSGSITRREDIFEVFKYNEPDSSQSILSSVSTSDGTEVRLDDTIIPGVRRTSLSDATVPYNSEDIRPLSPISVKKHATFSGLTTIGRESVMNDSNSDDFSGIKKAFPSLGIVIPPVDGPNDGSISTPGNGLFVDTPGNLIARGALSILESPLGSNETLPT